MEKRGRQSSHGGREPGGQNRRDFLKSGTLAGAAGLLAPGCGPEEAGKGVPTSGRPIAPGPNDIVLENRQARLIIGSRRHGSQPLAQGDRPGMPGAGELRLRRFFGNPVPSLRERAAAQVPRQVQDLPGPFGAPGGGSAAAGIRVGGP